MMLYGGIDLHSNNSLIALLDDQDKSSMRNVCQMNLGRF